MSKGNESSRSTTQPEGSKYIIGNATELTFFIKKKFISNGPKIYVNKMYTKSSTSYEKELFPTNDTRSSIPTGISWVHQKEIRDKRLLLTYTKSVSIPSKALLFLSIHMVHQN